MKRALPIMIIIAVAATAMIGIGYLFRPAIDDPYEQDPNASHSSVVQGDDSPAVMQEQLRQLDERIKDLTAHGANPDVIARNRLLRDRLKARIDAARGDAGP